MWHFLMLTIAYACILASPAEAAPKKKGPPPDPFKACDLQVRADLREGGTWLIPRDIRLDEARLMLSVTFSPEKSIRSVPKVLYGNSDEEKRRQLRGYVEEMKAAVDAATKESAWFVVASKRTLPPELRSSEGIHCGVLLGWRASFGRITSDIKTDTHLFHGGQVSVRTIPSLFVGADNRTPDMTCYANNEPVATRSKSCVAEGAPCKLG